MSRQYPGGHTVAAQQTQQQMFGAERRLPKLARLVQRQFQGMSAIDGKPIGRS